MERVINEILRSQSLINDIYSTFLREIQILREVDKFLPTDTDNPELAIASTIIQGLELYGDMSHKKREILNTKRVNSIINLWLNYMQGHNTRPAVDVYSLIITNEKLIKKVHINQLTTVQDLYRSLQSKSQKVKFLEILFGIATQPTFLLEVENYLNIISEEAV